jgi:hypothetical protein
MPLRTIGRKLQPSSHHRLKFPPKVADKELQTTEHKQFRLIVCRRAGWQCQWVENGLRCPKRAPQDRMIADHIVEREDGGSLYDPDNGQCLCVPHNTLKGTMARAIRSRAGG